MYRPAREGRSCEHFNEYKAINRIPLPLVRLPIFCSSCFMYLFTCANYHVQCLIPLFSIFRDNAGLFAAAEEVSDIWKRNKNSHLLRILTPLFLMRLMFLNT